MADQKRCWCGNVDLADFSPDYARCAACETLVGLTPAAQPVPAVSDDATDFYGRTYWGDFQQNVRGLPPLQERARTDMPERCVYWLDALLDYVLPPAKVLELGSAHGGFVGLMRQAGFDAQGLELSPTVVKYARQTFDVPMLTGPIEQQNLQPQTYDAICLMDVMEHLPDPAATLARCFELLKPSGVLLVQTPAYREGVSVAELDETGDRFRAQFKPGEHLHLFSRRAVRRLFERLSATHVDFRPAIFGFYDMFFAVTKGDRAAVTEEERVSRLSQTVGQRMVFALLDGEKRFRGLLEKHRQALAEQALGRRMRVQLEEEIDELATTLASRKRAA